MNAREYREHLYRSRSHPELLGSDFYDRRDSFSTLYLSIIPFLALEYYCEISFELLPSGLVFPTGYLLFWAFYYTYYKPGFLEDRLTSPQKWDLTGIPTVLVGVLIWFVKVTVVELSHFFVKTLFGVRGSTGGERRQRPRQGHHFHQSSARAQAQQRAYEQARASQRPRPKTPPPFPSKQASSLPRDISHALSVLGLQEGVDWNDIHKRYRELAKQYHPDLNHDITDVGRRFMMYDAAYRKLLAVKAQYFPEKRAHG